MTNRKYYFEYLLRVSIHKLAVLAYCEHFLVMNTAIIRLIVTRRMNDENSSYLILHKLLWQFTQIISDLIIIIMRELFFAIELKFYENLNLSHLNFNAAP